jgi:hypothetical protein
MRPSTQPMSSVSSPGWHELEEERARERHPASSGCGPTEASSEPPWSKRPTSSLVEDASGLPRRLTKVWPAGHVPGD